MYIIKGAHKGFIIFSFALLSLAFMPAQGMEFKKNSFTQEHILNLTLEIKSEEPLKDENVCVTQQTLWFCDKSNLTKKAILSNPILKRYHIDTSDLDEKTFRYCKELCLNDHAYTMGIGQAELLICENVPDEYKQMVLQKSDEIPYVKEVEAILKDTYNFVILKTFEIYAQYGGKGYGKLFFKQVMESLQTQLPHIPTVIFRAIPLKGNRITSEKLYEFYKDCGALQIKQEPEEHSNQLQLITDYCFYYNLIKSQK